MPINLPENIEINRKVFNQKEIISNIEPFNKPNSITDKPEDFKIFDKSFVNSLRTKLVALKDISLTTTKGNTSKKFHNKKRTQINSTKNLDIKVDYQIPIDFVSNTQSILKTEKNARFKTIKNDYINKINNFYKKNKKFQVNDSNFVKFYSIFNFINILITFFLLFDLI